MLVSMNSAAHKSTDIAFFKQHWFSKTRPQMKKTKRARYIEIFHLWRVHMIMWVLGIYEIQMIVRLCCGLVLDNFYKKLALFACH
jgi:hypothetical protein